MNTKEGFSVVIWRFVRGMVAAGLGQVFIMIDFSNLDKLKELVNNPVETQHVIVSAFLGGVLLALSKWVRNQSDHPVVQNLPV